MLGIGTVELAAIVVVTISVLAMYLNGYFTMRWALAVFCCAAVGALITPAVLYFVIRDTLRGDNRQNNAHN